MPETTYNPSITVDTGLYCPVCRGAIQANLTDSSHGPVIWDVFCDEDGKNLTHRIEPLGEVFIEFIENVPYHLVYSWARDAWDNYHKEKANAAH